MKKLTIIIVLLFPFLLEAQTSLTIHQKEGEAVVFSFESHPTVSFTETDLVLHTDGQEVFIPLNSLVKFTFDRDATAIDSQRENETTLSVKFDERQIQLSGARSKSVVRLFALDGRELLCEQVDEVGSLTISWEDLPANIYIVFADGASFKVLKR